MASGLPSVREFLQKYDQERVKTTTGTIEYRKDKNENNLKPEIIPWMFRDVSDMVEVNIEREVKSQIKESPHKKPQFNYKDGTRGQDENGITSVWCSDHGGKSAHGGIKINLVSPEEKRNRGLGADAPDLILRLLQITCKKDPPEVWMELAPMINESFESMKRSKLIAVQSKKNGELQCKMVPYDATEFKLETVSDLVHLTYRTSQVENRTESVPLKLISSASDFTWWTVIEKFRVVGTSDNLLTFIVLGRDGYSPFYAYPNFLRVAELNKDHTKRSLEYIQAEENQVTLEKLKDIALNEDMSQKEKGKMFGVKSGPIITFVAVDEHLYATLHNNMGMFDKVFLKHKQFLNNEVDDVSPEEADLKALILTKKEKLKPLEDERAKFEDEEGANLNHHIVSWKECVEQLKECDLSKDVRDHLEETRSYHFKLKNELSGKIKEIEKKMAPIEKEIYELEIRVKEIRKKRCTSTNEGIIAQLENLLKVIAGIYLCLYHGGSLNGVCVLRFFQYHTEIMKAHELECIASLQERRRLMGAAKCITDEELRTHLAKFSRAYSALDLVFSLLRLLAPSEEEMQNTDTSIRILEYIWSKELEIPWTPKALLTFAYASKQQREFGGLGDKGEDFGERMHQVRARNEKRTVAISNDFKKMELNHNQWDHARCDPEIKSITERVNNACKRKFKDGAKRATKQETREEERKQKRNVFFQAHKHLADKSSLV
jgi:hypothetical protein